MSTVAVKKVNQELYRKVKALASLRGRTVSDVVNEALGLWVHLTGKGATVTDWVRLEDEARRDNKAYEREEAALLVKHRGEFVAIGDGRKHAIVTRIEERPRKVVDLGWGVMEQLA